MNSRFCLIFPHLVIILAIVAGSVNGNFGTHGPNHLTGTWIGYEIGAPGEDWTISFMDNQATVSGTRCGEWFRGECDLTGAEQAGRIDILVEQASDRDVAGKIARGIYELRDGRLLLAMTSPGEESRPCSFESGESVRVLQLTVSADTAN